MGKANIRRGEKWTKVRAQAVYENRKEDFKWIDANKKIQEDMKEYEDSIKTTKSVGKK
jgi:hypothetical protein